MTTPKTCMLVFSIMLSLIVPSLSAEARKPNIIYILVDDLGYGDLSCYGQTKFKTPHIDSLATEGMMFTDHYSGSTVCAPSRCSLMTGLHTGHCQVRGNKEVKPEGQAPLLEGTVTIPAVLRNAGYVSGAFGKWGLGAPDSASDPMVFFDEFYGYNCQRQAHNFLPQHLWHNKEKVMLNGEKYSHDLIMQAAMNFIDKNQQQPFFCYLAITIPHAAMQAPKELHDKYRKLYPQFEDKTSNYGGAKVTNPVAAFPAMMEHMDNTIGDLLKQIKDLKLEEDTLIMFVSDNGAHKEGGHDPHFWDSNGPLTGLKRDLTEGGIRTPCLARWKGKIKPGSSSDHISAFWDMMPTFCEMAGIESPETDGISMLPALLGKAQKKHNYLYWEFSKNGGSQAIRKGKYKAIRKMLQKDPNAPVRLYDLSLDIAERKNIASEHPELVDEFAKLFKVARVESESFPLFKAPPKKKKKKGSGKN